MLFIALRDGWGVEIGAQDPPRRARLLDLGDHRRGTASQRADEVAHRPRGPGLFLHCRERCARLRRGDLGALRLDDALQDHAAALAFFVNATNSSIFAFAAPLLITWLARSTPALCVGATPAT